MPRWTIDTNILVYTAGDGSDPRHDLSRRIVDAAAMTECRLTLQALGEFFTVVTRKRILAPAAAMAQVEDWITLFDPILPDVGSLRTAMGQAGRFSLWDAQLLAAAGQAGCTVVLSEDMADGATLGPIRVVHPFAGAALSEGAAALLA